MTISKTEHQPQANYISRDFRQIGSNSRVAFWGTGKFSDDWQLALQERRPDIQLCFYINTYKEDLEAEPKVYRPGNIPQNIDAIIIVSSYFSEIIKQIGQFNIPSTIKLFSPFGLHDHDVAETEQITPSEHGTRGKLAETKKGKNGERLIVFSKFNYLFSQLTKRKNTDTLVAFYDMANAPATFDFANFLFVAEHERIKRNKKKIDIVIAPGFESHGGYRSDILNYYKKNSRDREVEIDYLNWRKFQIIIPLLRLLPSVSSFYCYSSREKAKNFLRKQHPHNIHPLYLENQHPINTSLIAYLVKMPKSTEATLRATDESKKYINQWVANQNLTEKKIVSITTRQCQYDEARNSNMEAWIAFANSLDREVFEPVFILDTETAFMDKSVESNFLVFKEAPWNIELRSAFYEKCFLNLMISNGPTTLAMFNKNIPFISFKQITEEVRSTSEFFLRSQGFKIGDQYPFFTDAQKFVWEEDSFDVITREFESFLTKT